MFIYITKNFQEVNFASDFTNCHYIQNFTICMFLLNEFYCTEYFSSVFYLILSNIYNAKKPYSFVLVFIKIKGTYNSENDAPTEIVYNI